MHEEKCIILDFLPNGYAHQRRPEPIAQALGYNFSLLEFVLFPGKLFDPEEEVVIDKSREKIRFIRRIGFDKLTNFALQNLEECIKRIIIAREKEFIDFFNTGKMITPRMHQFQLLPGVGKKHVVDILAQRKIKPFEGFDDLSKRVRMFQDPLKSLVKRVLDELKGNQKYYLFVRIPHHTK